jgi:hypothetical protein
VQTGAIATQRRTPIAKEKPISQEEFQKKTEEIEKFMGITPEMKAPELKSSQPTIPQTAVEKKLTEQEKKEEAIYGGGGGSQFIKMT